MGKVLILPSRGKKALASRPGIDNRFSLTSRSEGKSHAAEQVGGPRHDGAAWLLKLGRLSLSPNSPPNCLGPEQELGERRKPGKEPEIQSLCLLSVRPFTKQS